MATSRPISDCEGEEGEAEEEEEEEEEEERVSFIGSSANVSTSVQQAEYARVCVLVRVCVSVMMRRMGAWMRERAPQRGREGGRIDGSCSFGCGC
eukprot:COSAG06_NODE_5800_length_3266_cov_921.382697_2_plen_95_part_00